MAGTHRLMAQLPYGCGLRLRVQDMGEPGFALFLSEIICASLRRAGQGLYPRHHVLESGFQKAVKEAVGKTGILKRATVHGNGFAC